MDIGFIGLGNMGFPIAARLIAAGHRVLVYDTRVEAVDRAVALGAQAAGSVKEVGDRTDTVLASLPTPAASQEVATGPCGVIDGTSVRRFLDLSTVGSQVAEHNHRMLTARGIAAFDGPVSGGVAGAEKGTLTVMVSGPREEFDAVAPVIEAFGRAIFVDEKPGAAQTMKLINNLMAATALAATAEVMVMGVKAGLDAKVMIDVLNAGSGGTHASRDKFPRAVLPRTFDYGFATGLMVKDVRLYLQEAEALGTPTPIAAAVRALWEDVMSQQGSDSDFTCVVKPFEAAAGVVVDVARTTPISFVVDIVRARFDFDRQNARGVERARGASPQETLERLREVASRTSTPPAPLDTRIVEEVLHGEDIRRPLGLTRTYPQEAVLRSLRYQARTSKSFGGARELVAGIRLTATDTDLSIGDGPDVRGPARALLLAVPGRRVALTELDGPGVECLVVSR